MSHVDQKKRERLTAGLVKKTLNKEVRWKEATGEAGERAFAVDFDRSSVTLQRDIYSTAGASVKTVFLSVIGSRGNVVDRFPVQDALEHDTNLCNRLIQLPFGDPDPGETFIRLVESQVSGVDNVYDDVLKALAV